MWDKFGVTVRRVHERPVRPHPDWSCQLAVGWLALNRGGLVAFVGPETGDAVNAHTEHAFWLAAIRPLDVSVLQKG